MRRFANISQSQITFVSSSNLNTTEQEGDIECFDPFYSLDEPGEPIQNLCYPEAPDEVTPYELANFRNKVDTRNCHQFSYF